jgi:hypothetical protein
MEEPTSATEVELLTALNDRFIEASAARAVQRRT